jgi:hypothetical protein
MFVFLALLERYFQRASMYRKCVLTMKFKSMKSLIYFNRKGRTLKHADVKRNDEIVATRTKMQIPFNVFKNVLVNL